MDRYFAKIVNNKVVDVVIAEGYNLLTEGTWFETFTNTPGKKFAQIGDNYDWENNNYY